MIVSCYPRSGSSWFVRMMADQFDLYLTNKDTTYLEDGYSSRYQKAKFLSSVNQKPVKMFLIELARTPYLGAKT